MKNQIISLLLAAILALQLGITVFAENTETPIVPTDSGVEINGLSLVLNGEIGLTFHVYVPRKHRGGTMELKFMDERPITVNIADCPRDNNLCYTATYCLSAIELSEPVTLTVYTAEGEELAQKSCSAEEYAMLLRADEDATENEKKVAETLINYGHYAQLACSEANGWVIGEDIAETTAFYAPSAKTSVFNKYKVDWQNQTEELNSFSMALLLDYKTGIHLYFATAEKPTVTVNGEAAEATMSERLENNYEILIDGINALNLEDEYKITVNGAEFTISAFSYCNLAVANNIGTNTVDAMRALYEFYQATVAYNTSVEAE